MKQFTVDQANATLPLVRRIVQDIVAQHRVWHEKLLEIDLLAASGRASDAEHAERIEHDAQSVAREIETFRRELMELGIQLKDPRLGLIDFPSSRKLIELGDSEAPILLCWRLGEGEVQFWHDIDAGFAGRQPLVPESVG
jgi:hypothetical protein